MSVSHSPQRAVDRTHVIPRAGVKTCRFAGSGPSSFRAVEYLQARNPRRDGEMAGFFAPGCLPPAKNDESEGDKFYRARVGSAK